MKALLLGTFSGVLLYSCSANPAMDDSYLKSETRISSDKYEIESLVQQGKELVPLALQPRVSPCALSKLDLTNDPCNALNWQNYVARVLQLDDQGFVDELSSLNDSEVDHLKRRLLNVHRVDHLLEKKKLNERLGESISNYSSELQALLTTVVVYNRSLIEYETLVQQSNQQLRKLTNRLNETQAELEIMQQKIDAITNIEQQLNSEEGPTNDDPK